MGNIAAAGLNSLLGTDLGTTELPLVIDARIEGGDVTAGGDVSVVATDEAAIAATISNESAATASSAGLGVGASAILASNLTRPETTSATRGRAADDAPSLIPY